MNSKEKSRYFFRVFWAFLIVFFFGVSSAEAKVKVQWWHAMGGKLGEKVEEIAAKYNASQNQYEVVPVFKGNYTETMTGAIAAFRARKHPHIVQVFEVGTASMMAAKGAIKPVYELMAEAGEDFDQNRYLASVVGYYSTADGKMLSMPFNSSTPVLYYNKTAFRKAGLDPEKPPRTWEEVRQFSLALVKSGAVKAGFTTGWQSWVQIENFSAWHNVPIGTKANGFESFDTEFTVNSPLHVRHIHNMVNWQKDHVFKYGGRRSDGNPLFVTGEVAMLMNSSASYADIKSAVKFDFGVAFLPYYDDVKGAPQNSIIGGATLWVLAGHKKAEYQAVAGFFSFLSSAEIQADWHQFTGYLPITYAAYELTKKQGFYERNPGTDTAIKQMTLNPPTQNSKGLRFGNFVQIRDVFNEELEAAWAGSKTAQQALDDAVKRGNQLLRKFEESL
jgi:sn-glycerol 3-phosphate transport system substrate-binding protein